MTTAPAGNLSGASQIQYAGNVPIQQNPVVRADEPTRLPDNSQRPVSQSNVAGEFMQLFGADPAGLDPENMTLTSLRQAGANISQSLFDLIDNGVKLEGERAGDADGRISQEEIQAFIENVGQFMQMAQLPQTDAEFARVIHLYNKEGSQYKRLDAAAYSQLAQNISGSWAEASGSEAYSKAAQLLGGDASQLTPYLDGISRKVNGRDFGSAGGEGQMKTLVAFGLASSNGLDLDSIYELGGQMPQSGALTGEGASSANNLAGVSASGGQQPQRDDSPLLFTVGDMRVTKNMFDAALQKSISDGLDLPDGTKKQIKDLPPPQQKKEVFASLSNGLAAIQAAKHFASQASDADIKQALISMKIPEDQITSEIISIAKQSEAVLAIAAQLVKDGKLTEEDFNKKMQDIMGKAQFADTEAGRELLSEISGSPQSLHQQPADGAPGSSTRPQTKPSSAKPAEQASSAGKAEGKPKGDPVYDGVLKIFDGNDLGDLHAFRRQFAAIKTMIDKNEITESNYNALQKKIEGNNNTYAKFIQHLSFDELKAVTANLPLINDEQLSVLADKKAEADNAKAIAASSAGRDEANISVSKDPIGVDLPYTISALGNLGSDQEIQVFSIEGKEEKLLGSPVDGGIQIPEANKHGLIKIKKGDQEYMFVDGKMVKVSQENGFEKASH